MRRIDRKKRLRPAGGLALILAALLAFGPAAQTALAANAGQENAGQENIEQESAGQADAAETVHLSGVGDFLEFAEKCRDDLYSYGKRFVLEADIDLEGVAFDGVPYFSGTLEGGGHTIQNISISRDGSDYGLFRYVGKTGRISNLKASGKISMSGSGENIGGIAGVNFGVIDGCSFDGEVSGQRSVGGIAGYNKADGIIQSCRTAGRVIATNRTGGICGENKGILQQCTNRSRVNDEDLKTTLDLNGVDLGTLNLTQNVVTRNDTGGIAGKSSGTVSGCVNMEQIGYAHVGYNVGGIVGRQSGTLLDCTNNGTVLGRKDVGGIVGQAEPYRESEYLSDHLEKVRDDFTKINNLMGQMSDAFSSMSTSTAEYVRALQQQYEDTMDSLNGEISSLKDAVSGRNADIDAYMGSLSDALNNLSSLGDDTVSRLLESIRRNAQDAADNIKGKLDGIKDELKPDFPTETETDTGEDGTEDTTTDTESTIETGSAASTESTKTEQSKDPETDSSSGGNENSGETSEEAPAEAPDEAAYRESGGEAFAYFTEDTVRDSSEAGKPEEDSTEIGRVTIPDPIGDKLDNIHNIITSNPIRFESDEEIGENVNRMKNEISSVSGNLKGLQEAITGTGDSVTDAMNNISGELTDQSKASGDTVDSMTDTIDSGIRSMTSDLNTILNTSSRIGSIISDDIGILLGDGNSILDVSSATAARTLGVISGSQNKGNVEADINVGGIAGTMNVEYDIDPEMDLDLSVLTDVEVRSTTNDVVIHCVNRGEVTARKNNCGGIAGSEELGLIHDSANYGRISSESGTRIGGVAGYSVSRIDESSAFCTLEGKNTVGGITGEGYDISNSYAMATINGDAVEKIGSIAGTVDEEATLTGNWFVSDTWGGVDNINYQGRAQRCSYEEMLQLPGVPEGFRTVTVTFRKDGNTIASIQVPYGGTVSERDVPVLEAAGDSYIRWDQDFPIARVTSNLFVTAEDVRWTKSLAYGTEGEKRPDFLVEGNFYGDTVLEARAVEDAPESGEDTLLYAYRWQLQNEPEPQDSYVLHLRLPEEADGGRVLVRQGESWKEVPTETDGSYLTADIPGGADFAVYQETADGVTVYLVAGAAAVLLLALLLLRRTVKKKRAGRKK
ncbi:MAG: hypothetical protein Q4C65_03265 [Eubacteriales bacterium]|nr:hypothetical protein [Eubacteriales bacterium]